jgi:hypothetical protein
MFAGMAKSGSMKAALLGQALKLITNIGLERWVKKHSLIISWYFVFINMFYSHVLSRLGAYHKEADSIAVYALKSYIFILQTHQLTKTKCKL